MYCNNCGKVVQADWKMCPYCGSKNEKLFSGGNPQPNAQPVPQMNYNQPTPQMPYNQPMPQPSYNQQGYNQHLDFNKDFINFDQPKAKKSKLPIIITAVVLVAAIVLGVIFVPGLIKGKDEDEGDSSAGGNEPAKTTETVWVMTSCDDANGGGFELEYDSENNIKKLLFVDDASGYEYAYDSEGNLTEKTGWYYDYNEKAERSVYDKVGNLIEYYTYKYGDERDRTTYVYDSTGKLIKAETEGCGPYYSDEERETTYEYDSNGYCIKETEKNASSGLTYVTESTYDSKGRLTETRAYGSNGELWNIKKYKYNNNGHVVEYIYERYSDNSFDSKDTQTYQYEYDENGNIVKLTRYADGDFVCELVMGYNAVEVSDGKADKYNGQQEEIVDLIIHTSASMYNQVVC